MLDGLHRSRRPSTSTSVQVESDLSCRDGSTSRATSPTHHHRPRPPGCNPRCAPRSGQGTSTARRPLPRPDDRQVATTGRAVGVGEAGDRRARSVGGSRRPRSGRCAGDGGIDVGTGRSGLRHQHAISPSPLRPQIAVSCRARAPHRRLTSVGLTGRLPSRQASETEPPTAAWSVTRSPSTWSDSETASPSRTAAAGRSRRDGVGCGSDQSERGPTEAGPTFGSQLLSAECAELARCLTRPLNRLRSLGAERSRTAGQSAVQVWTRSPLRSSSGRPTCRHDRANPSSVGFPQSPRRRPRAPHSAESSDWGPSHSIRMERISSRRPMRCFWSSTVTRKRRRPWFTDSMSKTSRSRSDLRCVTAYSRSVSALPASSGSWPPLKAYALIPLQCSHEIDWQRSAPSTWGTAWRGRDRCR